MENIEAVVPGQFHQFEEGPEAEGLDLRKDAEARSTEFIEMKGGKNLKGVFRGSLRV